MNRRNLIKTLSGGAVALWTGGMWNGAYAQTTTKTTTTTTTTTTPTTPTEPSS